MKPREDDAWGAPDYAEEELSFPAIDDFTFGSGELEGVLDEHLTTQLDALEEETAFELPPEPMAAQSLGFTPGESVTDQPIPRIRIRLCSDRPEITHLMEQASQDRRLGKAELSIEPGGIDAAIAFCASNSRDRKSVV